jgi:hypothetical protein
MGGPTGAAAGSSRTEAPALKGRTATVYPAARDGDAALYDRYLEHKRRATSDPEEEQRILLTLAAFEVTECKPFLAAEPAAPPGFALPGLEFDKHRWTSPITWFQAQEACANAGKRLPSNAEWQVAANGTPDPGPDNGTTDCNTASTFAVALTGSRSNCVSARRAFDMVGNLYEWVADWVPASTGCPLWGSFTERGTERGT